MKSVGKYDPGPKMKGKARVANEVSFYQAVAIAAIGHDVGKVFTDLKVMAGEDRSLSWNPYCETLAEFCDRNGSAHIQWTWYPGREGKHESPRYSLWMAGQWLSALDIFLSKDMAEALNAALNRDAHSVIWDCVRQADCASVSRDRKTSSNFGQKTDPLVVIRTAVNKLMDSKQWSYNRSGSPVWVTDFGVVLVNPVAFKHIHEYLQHARGVEEEARFEHYQRVIKKLLELNQFWTYETDTEEDGWLVKFKPSVNAKASKPLHGVIIRTPEAIGLIGTDSVQKAQLELAETEKGVPLKNYFPGSETPAGKVDKPKPKGKSTSKNKEKAPEAEPPMPLFEQPRQAETTPPEGPEPESSKAPKVQKPIETPEQPDGNGMKGEEKDPEQGGVKEPEGEGAEDQNEKLLLEFMGWVIEKTKEELLIIGTSREALADDPGFWDAGEEGLLTDEHPIMMFCSANSKYARTPMVKVLDVLTQEGVLTPKGGLFVVLDALAKELREASNAASA